MKQHRLVFIAAAMIVLGSCAVAFACDQNKNSQASAASTGAGTCTAAMAAKCTAAQAAACRAHHATAANATSCSGAGNSAAASTDHCGGKNASATATAMKCGGDGVLTIAGTEQHADCDACADMARADAELTAAGAHRQVVALKNGVIFVYTADSPSQVRLVQTAMTRRSERLTALLAAGDNVKLCKECKAMRGAMASGKLRREVVNIEGGCLTLMTSTDASVVARMHSMADQQLAARIKS